MVYVHAESDFEGFLDVFELVSNSPEMITEPVVPVVSIVIPVRNGLKTLAAQLDALTRQLEAPDFEVVLVDHSAPWDINTLNVEYPSLRITVVDASDCVGLSSVRNRGITSSLGAKVLCLDDDDVAGDAYVSEMSRALDLASFVMARIELDLLNKAWRRDVRSVPQEYGPGSGSTPWGYAGTLGFRRAVFDEVGGFANRLDGSTGEDIDFCIRCSLAGYTPVFVHRAVLHYRFRHGYRALFEQGVRWGRGGIRVDRAAWPGWKVWLRGLFGSVRLLIVVVRPGKSRRGAFLLGRYLGLFAEHLVRHG